VQILIDTDQRASADYTSSNSFIKACAKRLLPDYVDRSFGV
jgi:hypothetical protein